MAAGTAMEPVFAKAGAFLERAERTGQVQLGGADTENVKRARIITQAKYQSNQTMNKHTNQTHPARAFKILAISASLLFAMSCQTPQEIKIVKKEGGGFRLDQIGYCADRACEIAQQGFEVRLKKDNILLIYLDLRNTGGLNLITRIANGSISAANLIVKSQTGWVMARVPINLKEIRYKIIQEVEFRAVPYSGAREEETALESLETEKVILEPYRNITEETHFGDHDVIPQAIPLTLNTDAYKIDAVIYLEFELTTSTVDSNMEQPLTREMPEGLPLDPNDKNSKTNRDEKDNPRNMNDTGDGSVEINEFSMIWTNLATPPFSFTIIR